MFDLQIADTSELSYDTAPLALPTPWSVLTTRTMLPRSPLGVRHATAVVEVHSLASQPLAPKRTLRLPVAHPNPPPDTITDELPVAATFILLADDTDVVSAVTASVILPTTPDPVADTRRDGLAVITERQASDVSDPHSLASQLVLPTLPCTLPTPPNPSPAPEIVKDELPVLATLPVFTLDTVTWSADIDSVTLPVIPPEVTASLLVLPARPTVLHTTEVSEPHAVDSQPVPPPRAPALIDTPASPDPTNITTTDPVLATFCLSTDETLPRSTDNASLMLPTAAPTVTDRRRDPLCAGNA